MALSEPSRVESFQANTDVQRWVRILETGAPGESAQAVIALKELALAEIRNAQAAEPIIAVLEAWHAWDKTVRQTQAQALGTAREIEDYKKSLLGATGYFEPEYHPIRVITKADEDCGSLSNAIKMTDGALYWAAVEGLARVGATAIEPVIAALSTGDQGVRRAAAQALGRVGDKRAVESLIGALNDIPSEAAWALGKIPDARAVEPLIAAMERAWDTKGSYGDIVDALGEIGDARAVRPMLRIRKTKRNTVGFITWAQVFGQIGDMSAWDALESQAQHGYLGLEMDAAREALARIAAKNREAVIERLARKLERSDPRASGMEAWALGRIKETRATELLIKALGHPSVNMRWNAAKGLGMMGDKGAIPQLRTSLNDPMVRAEAAEAISMLEKGP